MLTLVQAQVWKYKSIEDSTPVKISDDVTVLVGKNESGKTAFLEALYKALPLGDKATFSYIADYPRKDLFKYQKRHSAGDYETVVTLTFRIGSELAKRINNELFSEMEVIGEGHTFSHHTTYNNSDTIGFSIDETRALTALEKPLNGLEHKDDVFAGSKSLEDVLKKIESKTLAADSKLALFASQWRARAFKEPAGWRLIEGHIWQKYLLRALPKFLYFDDYQLLGGKINLPTLQQRDAASPKQLTGADETAKGLLELAGATLQELMSNEGYETAKAKLEAIGLSITQSIFAFWKQNQDLDVEFDLKADPADVAPFSTGINLYIRIKNRRHGLPCRSINAAKDLSGFLVFLSGLTPSNLVHRRRNH